MAKAKFDLEAYKKTIEVADTPLKPDEFIKVDECLQEVTGLLGWPLGHITQVFGKSDTSKTSLMLDAMAKAQQQGIFVVCIITEGKIDWDRAKAMGFDKSQAITNENCEFLEDVFEFIDKITSDVSSGELPYNTMIFFDSIGNTLSRDEVKIQEDGTWEKVSTMMKASKKISEYMRVISKKINDTRKVSYPKSVGLFIINQAYTSPASFPGGQPSLTPYGGASVYYRSTLVIKTSKVKKLMVTKNGNTFGFGIIAKITTEKNHLSNTTNSGEFVVTADRIIPNEKTAIEEYKKEKKSEWGEEFELIVKADES